MTRWWQVPKIKWLLLGILATELVIFGVYFEVSYKNKFYPGVILGKESVGGLTYEDAYKKTKGIADQLSQSGLRLIFEGEKGEREVRVPSASAGLTTDNVVEYFSLGNWEKKLKEAYAWGRSGSIFQKISEQSRLFFTKKKFEFPAAAQEEALISLLAREPKSFFHAAAPAEFAWQNGAVKITHENIGESVNRKIIIETIKNKLANFDLSPETFRAKADVPIATEKKLHAHLKLAEELAKSAKIIFTYEGRRWKVDGKTLITWLTLKTNEEIGVNTKKLDQYLARTVARAIDNPPQNSRFEMRGGKLTEILPGKSGNVVDIKKTTQKVEQLVLSVQKSFAETNDLWRALASLQTQITADKPTGTITVPIETVHAEPKITRRTVEDYNIKDLVGFAKTNFAGSSDDRRHNIETGVSKLTGILLAPGEEFSAVIGIGTTTEEEGFVPEFVIKESKSVKELGGGLCQLATTLFRLALNAGMPITERVNHRYVVGYYGPGLDATIYGPHPDFKFINDTNNYLLLQGRVEGTELIFELYGQKDGRLAEVSEVVLSEEKPAPETKYALGPDIPLGKIECSETPRKGMTADATYTVRYANGETQTQEFHSVYQPWQKICLIGTKGL